MGKASKQSWQPAFELLMQTWRWCGMQRACSKDCESLKATLCRTYIFIFKRKRIDICINYSSIAWTKCLTKAAYDCTLLWLLFWEIESIMATGTVPSTTAETHVPSSHFDQQKSVWPRYNPQGPPPPRDPLPAGPRLLRAHNLPKQRRQMTSKCSKHKLVGNIPHSNGDNTLSPQITPGSISKMC